MDIKLVNPKNHQIIWLRLSAEQQPSDTTPQRVQIHWPESPCEKSCAIDDSQNRNRIDSQHFPVMLRYAAKRFFAPKRLQQKPTGLTQETLPATSLALAPGQPLNFIPIHQIHYQNLYLTSLYIENPSQQIQTLEVAKLRGEWIARGFMQTNLLPDNPFKKGQARNNLLFLFSHKPFHQQMKDIGLPITD